MQRATMQLQRTRRRGVLAGLQLPTYYWGLAGSQRLAGTNTSISLSGLMIGIPWRERFGGAALIREGFRG